MQKMLYGTMGILDHMEKRTDQTIRKLDSFGERAQGIRHPSIEGTVQENRRISRSGRIQESRESLQSRRNQEIRKPSVRGSLKSIQAQENSEAGQKVHRRAKLAVR